MLVLWHRLTQHVLYCLFYVFVRRTLLVVKLMLNLIKGDLVDLELYLCSFLFHPPSHVKGVKGDRRNVNRV
jgi:hypothetical protein